MRLPTLGLLAAVLIGCSDNAVLDGDGLAADIAPGETIVVYLYEVSGGMETQAFTCTDDDDGVSVDDASIVLVTPLGSENVTGPNNYEPDAMKYALTGLKVGRVALTSTCNGEVSSRYLYVR